MCIYTRRTFGKILNSLASVVFTKKVHNSGLKLTFEKSRVIMETKYCVDGFGLWFRKHEFTKYFKEYILMVRLTSNLHLIVPNNIMDRKVVVLEN